MTDINRLTCEEVFRRLDDYLDRELSAAEMELVKAHLETCDVCTREYDFEAKVISTLRERLRRISAPRDLVSKIDRSLAELRKEGSGG